eukprot:4992012-Karenia_brevis.AAC.1
MRLTSQEFDFLRKKTDVKNFANSNVFGLCFLPLKDAGSKYVKALCKLIDFHKEIGLADGC